MGERIERLYLKIGGISCSFCVETIEKAVSRIDGVESVRVSLAHEELIVYYNPKLVTKDEIIYTLEELGYTIKDPRRARALEESMEELRRARRRLIKAGIITIGATILMVSMWLGLKTIFHPYIAMALALSIMAGPGLWIKKRAYNSIKRGILNQHVLLEIGALSGFIGGILGLVIPRIPPGELFIASVYLTAYHILGDYTSAFVRVRSDQAIIKLLSLQPKRVTVVVEGNEFVKSIDDLRVGEVVRVRPGERIPCDGVIIMGKATVDESIVTGEPTPVIKNIGDDVVGGSICVDGTLDIEVTAVGEDSFLGRIIKYVEEARAFKPNIILILDKVLRYYIPFVLITGLASFTFWIIYAYIYGTMDLIRPIYALITVYVMGYPCALGMAMPLAIIRSNTAAAMERILVRSGEAYQVYPYIDVIVFDKTGTVTYGRPKVVDVYAEGIDRDELIYYAATAERYSEHPIARALVEYAEAHEIYLGIPREFHVYPGEGVSAIVSNKVVLVGRPKMLEEEGIKFSDYIRKMITNYAGRRLTTVAVSIDGVCMGVIGLRDLPREEAHKVIQKFKKDSVKTILLSGDNKMTVREIARDLGFDKYYGDVMPERKVKIIRGIQESGARVAMVGDGINDAPALTQADVGIALATGTDIAIESSDIIITGGNLMKVYRAKKLLEKGYRRTKENLLVAFIFNGVGVPIAATGLLPPTAAMIAMILSVSALLINTFRGL